MPGIIKLQKLVIGVLATLLFVPNASALPSAAASNLILNGREVPPSHTDLSAACACIDLDYLCEQVGAQYMYEPHSQIIVAYKKGKTVQMQVGNSDVWVDQRYCRFPLSVYTRNGKVLVPFQDVALVLGGEAEIGRRPDYTMQPSGKRLLCPGVTYDRYVVHLPGGPAVAHVATIDLTKADLELKAVLAREKMAGRETVSQMARRENAVLAVNASFFTSRGNPLGMVITNSQLISVPIMSRSVFGWTRDRDIIFGNPRFQGVVHFRGGVSVELDGVNQKPGDDESVILYTPEFGEKTPVNGARREVALLGGKVVATGAGELAIPPGGMVISASGERADALAGIEIWSPATINYGLGKKWGEVKEAVGGGPRLVMDGAVRITGSEERFQNDVLKSRAPRSALGFTASQKLLLVAVDGRQPGYSIGMTLEELAGLFIKLGAVDAMNLDGGGSTTMVAENEVVNSPSGGSERSVGSAVLVCRGSATRRYFAQRGSDFSYE